jgi:hypothetical protein
MNIQELQIKWFWIIPFATHQTGVFTAIVGAVIANT